MWITQLNLKCLFLDFFLKQIIKSNHKMQISNNHFFSICINSIGAPLSRMNATMLPSDGEFG
jgi:hypothetical protein